MLEELQKICEGGNFFYLASPYSNPDPGKRTLRCLASHDYHEWFLMNRVWTLPAIWLTHHTAVKNNLPFTAADWISYNKIWMDKSAGTIVACMEGWEDSIGVKQEINYTRDQGKKVYLAVHDNGFMSFTRVTWKFA